MALFGNREGKDRATDTIPSSTRVEAVAPREAEMFERDRNTSQAAGGTDAFLGKGTKVTGKLVFEGTGRIEGQIEGEIAAQDTLTIGESAIVNAKISGTLVVIEGQVTGDVVARQRLELRASARVQGNVTAPSLVVHEGAVLDGQCSMGGAQTKAAPRDKSEKAATQSLDQARDTAIRVASALNQ